MCPHCLLEGILGFFVGIPVIGYGISRFRAWNHRRRLARANQLQLSTVELAIKERTR